MIWICLAMVLPPKIDGIVTPSSVIEVYPFTPRNPANAEEFAWRLRRAGLAETPCQKQRFVPDTSKPSRMHSDNAPLTDC